MLVMLSSQSLWIANVAYLELADTTVSNGTAARGWELRIDQPGLEVAQEWVLYHFEKKKFLQSVLNCIVLTSVRSNMFSLCAVASLMPQP